MSDLTNKVALVTGASRGIGRALAVGLAQHGANLVICDLPSEIKGLMETKDIIETSGRTCWHYGLDVTDQDEVNRVIENATQSAEKIDILVNNAGVLKPSNLENLTESDWDAHFNVNAKGLLFATNAVLPQMRERKNGRIINIASIAGRQGVPTQGHYAATKATAITLTRVYAQEVGMDGITVNAVCPGIILTEMGKNNLGSEDAIQHWQEVAALKRLGQPEDVIGPVVFFASDLSKFVTGQALNVCGGIYFH